VADNPLPAALHIDAQLALVDNMLHYFDRTSMAHSLEVRVPFLDPAVAGLALALPREQKVWALQKKRLLRRAAARVLPASIVFGPKRGFSIPAAAWLRGPLLPMTRDLLAPDAVRRRGFFRPEAVTRLLDEHALGREDHSRPLWGLLCFELWATRSLPR
jgi:asparagine synthase (glutamine-hydrolysing)